MKNNPNIIKLVFVLGIIVLFAVLRIFIQIPNVSPIAAIALFGGTMIKRKELALLLPLAILFISDLFIGTYSAVLMAFVYGGFILVGMLGFILRKSMKAHRVFAASLLASVVFFVVSNFGVWAQGLWYPLSWEGLVSCYAMAIPFFKYEIVGTLAFSLFFFASYELSARRIPALKLA
ncbi:MAG: hypothetical protein C0592_11030 [Marinilabiliales bacterium]|nr:MAG: hypothetical protein C0592_11030 [Marinilabiliales bacterium]